LFTPIYEPAHYNDGKISIYFSFPELFVQKMEYMPPVILLEPFTVADFPSLALLVN